MAFTKEEWAEHDRAMTVIWASEHGSPLHCVTVCRTYVGHNHVLLPRHRDCRLGSEVPREVIDATERNRVKNEASAVAYFKGHRG